jgi:6-phosphogluconolactonase
MWVLRLGGFLAAAVLTVAACSDDESGTKPAADAGIDAADAGIDAAGVDAADSSTPVQTFRVGGTVSGLQGTGLVLQNNADDDLPIAANGTFTFAKQLPAGATFAVSIKAQPPAGEVCKLTAPTGTIAAANVTSVIVDCASPFTIDQLTTNGVTGSLPTFRVGQTFLAPKAGRLTRIDVWAAARLAGAALPSDTTVEVYAVAGGLPTGAALATSATVTVPEIAGMNSFTFATPATLAAGTTYAAIVTCKGANEVNVGISTANPYAGGTLVWDIPDTPTAVAANDLRFQAFLSP